LRNSLPPGFIIFYSLKANPHPDIARALREAGPCRAEVCSVGELSAALEAGFAASECLYTGPGKTTGELMNAVARGVREFSVESLTDLARVGHIAERCGVVINCLLRINDIAPAAPGSIRMMGTPSQFGIDAEMLEAQLPEMRAVPGTRLAGAHFFSLSNASDEPSLVSELRQSLATAARLHAEFDLPMELLDLGGGFGAPYAAPGSRPVYDTLRIELETALDAHFPQWRAGVPRIAIESGRYLVADSGELLISVVNVKESRGRRFVILDAGINTLGGMSGLGRLMPVAVRPDDGHVPFGTPVATLAGPLCTPGDILARNVPLRSVKPGDLITVPNVGAYGVTASLVLFLSRAAPREVVVRGGEVMTVSQLRVDRSFTI
jgi:diaminopimelate decarboxylase